MTCYFYKTQLHFNFVCVVMKSRFSHAHSEHRYYGLEPAAGSATSTVSTEFPGEAVMPRLQQMAVPCPILCVRGAARRKKGDNSPWNTGNGRKTPNPTPQGNPFSYYCFIKDILSQKDPISTFFLIFPEMILSSVFKNTWDNKLYI